MSSDCQCFVALPHGAVGSTQCVVVVFPDHTHLLFLTKITYISHCFDQSNILRK